MLTEFEGPMLERLPEGRPLFHHGREMDQTTYGEVWSRPLDAVDSNQGRSANRGFRWLIRELGFNPVFLAVGSFNTTRLMMDNAFGNKDVYFSFTAPPAGVFSDYRQWERILLFKGNEDELHELVFRPGYTLEDWIRKAWDYPRSVQYMTPSLDLRQATTVRARLPHQVKELGGMGFSNASVTNV